MTDAYASGAGPAEDARELDLLKRRIAELQEDLGRLREELGGREEGPGDAADSATLLTTFEAQTSLLDSLLARERDLQGRRSDHA